MSGANMPLRPLGRGGPQVSALGLGTMSFSDVYGAPDDAESLATLELALERGITFLDTADFYGNGHSEQVLGRWLKGHRRDQVFLSVKIGPMRVPGGGFGPPNGHPDYIRNALAYDLTRLGVDQIDLYFPSRLDRKVPLEDQIGALADLKGKGYIRHIGLSEVSAATVRRAHALHPVLAVQTEYSLWTRDAEAELLPTLRELGIACVGYAPLGRGMLTGRLISPDAFEPRDIRRHSPRYQGANFTRNQALVESLRGLAARKGITPAQLAMAWVLSNGQDVLPLMGTKSRARLAENLGALEVSLTSAEVAELSAAFPPGAAAGDRYPPAGMAVLDS
jgi:aryl-alcohol dehydrogenase-like predicted oxidoreductase